MTKRIRNILLAVLLSFFLASLVIYFLVQDILLPAKGFSSLSTDGLHCERIVDSTVGFSICSPIGWNHREIGDPLQNDSFIFFLSSGSRASKFSDSIQIQLSPPGGVSDWQIDNPSSTNLKKCHRLQTTEVRRHIVLNANNANPSLTYFYTTVKVDDKEFHLNITIVGQHSTLPPGAIELICSIGSC